MRSTSSSTDTAHRDEVELHFLPLYSPELNPDKLVNADLKHSLPKQHCARAQAELAAETRRSCYAYKSCMPPLRYHVLPARAWSKAVSKLLGSYAA
ncbi:transposase [Streptomyces sp. NBC_00388]|uniref:transposase n=1 Tax=Streptomyces sp. NBC_00388 TaxID=2975735 RepID=UPI003FA78163